jgi:hypothetical protein
MEKSTARSLSVFRLIPEQFQTNKLHDTSKIGQNKKRIVRNVNLDSHSLPLKLKHLEKMNIIGFWEMWQINIGN